MERNALACAALLLGCAQTTSGPPALTLDTIPQCPQGGIRCINAGTTSFDVNGVRVIHRRLEGHPLVALQVYFDVISPPGGVQYWSETVALELLESDGPERLPRPEWTDRLAALNASVSAVSRIDERAVGALVPMSHWRALWTLLVEALEHPHTDQSSLDSLRAGYESDYLRRGNEPESATSRAAFSMLYRGEPNNVGNESRAALAAVSESDLNEAWRCLRTKERMLVVVVGDVSEQAARAGVRDGLGWLAGQHAPNFAEVELEPGPDSRLVVMDFPESPTWYVRSYFKGPPADAPEYAALRLGVWVLNRRLLHRVRDEKGLADTIGSRIGLYKQTDFRVWFSSTAPATTAQLVHEVVDELKHDGPRVEELDTVRAEMQADELASVDTPAGMAAVLARWQIAAGDRTRVEEHFAQLAAASPDDVVAALNAFMRDGTTAAAGPGGAVTEADLRALYE